MYMRGFFVSTSALLSSCPSLSENVPRAQSAGHVGHLLYNYLSILYLCMTHSVTHLRGTVSCVSFSCNSILPLHLRQLASHQAELIRLHHLFRRSVLRQRVEK